MVDDSRELVTMYATAGSMEEAERIAEMLIEERLAACVNILGGVTSIFRWQGKVQREREVVLVAKTRRALSSDVLEAVQRAHSYDTPCVTFHRIDGVSRKFGEWVVEQTREPRTGKGVHHG